LSGAQIEQTYLKCLAYTDDIYFVALNDNECELIRKFCSESDAAINLQKSLFIRVNNCKIGPQQIKETNRLKILGFSFHADSKTNINFTYNSIISTINYMYNLNMKRRINILQKNWFSNTFVLLKLWYMSQFIPPDNLHIAKI
jgi:hypothetical protein